MARRLAAVSWVAALGAALAGLVGVGEGVLAAPPADPATWTAWASDRTAVEGAGAALRLVALGVVGYVLAVSALGLTAGLLRRRGLVAALARWSPPALRWLLGAWLTGTLAAGPASASAVGPPPTMVLLPEGEDPPAPATTATTTTTVPVAPVPAPAPPVTTATLGPGDHLWSVAARTLATAWGRPPAEREVTPYWRLLVELNRSELPNPGDPDLVFPGDVVRLPPIPG